MQSNRNDNGHVSPPDKFIEALQLFADFEPERHDLVAGCVGAIGVHWDPIIDLFKESFERYHYSLEKVHVSRLLGTCLYKPWGNLPDRRQRNYYTAHMDACDLLRREVKNGSAMAALAISHIHEVRKNQLESQTSENTVYLLKSLKHPDEVKLLRHVYGEAFFLVGIASSKADRRDELNRTLADFSPDRNVEVERLNAYAP